MNSDKVVVIANASGENGSEMKTGRTKEERAFNSALKSYAKKFGLKYSKGKITSPELDDKLKKLREYESTSRAQSNALSEIIRQVQQIRNEAIRGQGPLSPETIEERTSIGEAQLNNRNINNGPLSPEYIQRILNSGK